MEKTNEFLKKLGIEDVSKEYVSSKRFSDGGQYRFEVPGIQSPGVMKVLLETIDSYGLHLHRVTQTKGIMSLMDEVCF